MRHGKGYRRFGVPCIITLVALYNLYNPLGLILLALIGVFFIGYGIPDNVQEIGQSNIVDWKRDEGSRLGRFWYNIFKRNEFLANIFTRGTIGLLICLIISIIPIIIGNWETYLISSMLIIYGYSAYSWKSLGSIIIKRIPLAKCEIYLYFTISFLTLSLTL